MATARGVIARNRGLSVLSSTPEIGPVSTASAAEQMHGAAANVDAAFSGRISLGMLGALIVIVGVFYIATHSIQGGG